MLWTMKTGAFYWWHFECTEVLWRDPEAHCCAIHRLTMTSCCSMIMHRPQCCKNLYTIPGAENIPVLAWPAYSPDMSPIEHVWDAQDRCIRQHVPVPVNIQQLRTAIEGVDQHSTGHNQQPDQLYAKEICCTAWGKWWSHHILTGFRSPLPTHNTVKLHILEGSFIVASLRHTCAIIMLSTQHLDMPHLWGGWIISAKDKCSLTHIKTDLWTIFERNRSVCT